MPSHPTIFRFLFVLQTAVIQRGYTTVAQYEAGTAVKKPANQCRLRLAEKAAAVEEEYRRGALSAREVLIAAASHYQELNGDSGDEEGEDENEIEGSSQTDERLSVLAADEDLEDVDTDDWETSNWPEAG